MLNGNALIDKDYIAFLPVSLKLFLRCCTMLYGLCAHGAETKTSDVDMGVVVSRPLTLDNRVSLIGTLSL